MAPDEGEVELSSVVVELLLSSCVRRRSWTFFRSLNQGAFFSGELVAPESAEGDESEEAGLGGTGLRELAEMLADLLVALLLFVISFDFAD